MNLRLFKNKRTFTVLALVLALLGLASAPFARFSYDFEKFFPEDNALTQQFNEHRARFGSDNDFLLIALPIRTEQEIQNGNSFYQKLKNLPEVQDVNGVFNYPIIKKDPFTNVPFELDLINQNSVQWNLFESQSFDFNHLFSKDSSFTLIRLEHTAYLSNQKSRALYEGVMALLEDNKIQEAKVVGRIAGQIHYLNVMQSEMTFFVIISLFLIVLFVYFIYRSWKLVIATLIIVAISIIGTIGAVVLGGESLNLLLSIVPSIIFIVAISDVVHYLSTLQITNVNLSIEERLSLTFKKVGVPTGLTSLTTAIGFITLSVSNIQPLRVFGLYTGFGIVLTYVFTFAFLPILIKKWQAVPLLREEKNHRFLNVLESTFDNIMHHQKKVLGVFLILLIIGVHAFFNIQTNNYLLEDLHEGDPVRVDFQYMDDEMGGSRPMEFALHLNNLDLSQLQKFKSITTDIFEVHNGFDLLELLKRAHYYRYGNYQLPKSEKRLTTLIQYIKKEEGLWESVVKDNWYRFRGVISDKGGQDYLRKESQFYHKASTLFPNMKYYVTGAATLIDHNNELLSGSIIKGLILAFVIIALIVAYFFRSTKMIIIALLVNIIPLFMVLSLMYWMGVDIKISTSIIFSIVFGIAVDDTIHFLMRFRVDREQNMPLIAQLKSTYLHSARLLAITTFIILSGFIMLLASKFTATYYVGVYVSSGLFLALISDLTLLPILIRLFYQKR